MLRATYFIFPSFLGICCSASVFFNESDVKVDEMLSTTTSAQSQRSTHEQNLYRALFSNYNKHLRPLRDPNKAIKVHINPSISGIIKADELDQSLKFFHWFPMTWKDEFLVWDPSKFGGLQYMFVPSELIWFPDIFAFTTMEAKEVMPLEKMYARLDHSGNVTISKHQFLTVRCQFRILLFPFDVQQCRMPFGSWAYTIQQLELDDFESQLAKQIFEENAEWEIVSFSAKKETVTYDIYSQIMEIKNRTFHELHYDLVFKRKPTFYIHMIVVPCSVIVNICLLGLFAPFNTKGDRHEKLTLGLTTLLTVAVLLNIVSGEMPKSSEGLPLLGKFILLELVVCGAAVAVTVLLMYGHRQVIKRRCPPPNCVRSYIVNFTRLKVRDESAPLLEERAQTEMSEMQLDYSDILSKNFHTQTMLQKAMLKSCVGHVSAMRKQLLRYQDDTSLRETWNIAFEWIDMILLAAFLSVNLLLTCVMFVVMIKSYMDSIAHRPKTVPMLAVCVCYSITILSTLAIKIEEGSRLHHVLRGLQSVLIESATEFLAPLRNASLVAAVFPKQFFGDRACPDILCFPSFLR